jgi:hypothetical protein
MLRNWILGACVFALACVTAATLSDWTAWPSLLPIGLLTAAVAFERARYADRVLASQREPLAPTQERFIDPESGALVEVWQNARGERHYVERNGSEDLAV